MLQHYFKKMDNGKWMEVIVDFSDVNGSEIGYIIDAIIYDEKPDMSHLELIYDKNAELQ